MMFQMYWSTSQSSDKLRAEPIIMLKFVLKIMLCQQKEL